MVGRSTVTTQCPRCGHEFEVQTRAALGEGTQKARAMKVNANRQAILDVLDKPMSVRDIQQALVIKQIRRVSKRKTGWNYHSIQADLSNLIAMKRVEMIRPHEKEIYDKNEGHTTGGVPLYRKTLPVVGGTKNDENTF